MVSEHSVRNPAAAQTATSDRSSRAPKTYVYVDGFNLFYGALRRTPYRWLDLAKLCRLYLPNDDVRKIKYFTAIVSARPSDPDQPVRQQLYLRAFQTVPEVEIFYGHFLAHPVQMPLAPAPLNKPTRQECRNPESSPAP